MSTKEQPFDLAVAAQAVTLDVQGVLGAFLEGKVAIDASLGNASWRSDTSTFFAVRWTLAGKHTGPIAGFGHTQITATGNPVTVSALTIVEDTANGAALVDDLDSALRSGRIVFHRFVDWLAVFAQIGVLHLGRPMPLDGVELIPQGDLNRNTWPSSG
jgi:hypothetical protein